MRRTLVMGLVLALVSLLAGVFVVSQTFPSEREISRISFEELGLEGGLLDQPFVHEIFVELQKPVRERVLRESREAMVMGAAAMVLVNVAGVALVAADHRRRAPEGTPAKENQAAS